MSVKVMSAVWEMDFPDATKKLVMLALADFTNDQGECYPMMRTIARKAGISQRQTRRIVSEFVSNGLVSRELQVRRNGSKAPSLYRVLVATPHRSPMSYTPIGHPCPMDRSPVSYLEPSYESQNAAAAEREKIQADQKTLRAILGSQLAVYLSSPPDAQFRMLAEAAQLDAVWISDQPSPTVLNCVALANAINDRWVKRGPTKNAPGYIVTRYRVHLRKLRGAA